MSVASKKTSGHPPSPAMADELLSEGANWSPKKGQSPEFPDVPETIASAAKEAYGAASIGAFKAAILMSRTVIEATAKAKEISSGSLMAKIDAMKAANLIRPGIAEAAHEIRNMGNDMAHGDIDYRVTAADAEDILQLMSQVLNEVFQGPALTAAIRARRAAREKPDTSAAKDGVAVENHLGH